MKEIPVLYQTECTEVFQQIEKLREHWAQFSSGLNLPFYTLGIASYLIASKGYADSWDYYKQAKKLNPLLMETFGPLYEKVKESLEEYLHEKVAYPEKISIPGFHLFFSHPLCTQPLASIHLRYPVPDD